MRLSKKEEQIGSVAKINVTDYLTGWLRKRNNYYFQTLTTSAITPEIFYCFFNNINYNQMSINEMVHS